jgi:hypothetical protein
VILSTTLFSLGKLGEIKMKSIFLLALVFCSTSLLAQESKLILNQEHLSSASDKITIVRTSSTPDKVKIKLLVPTQANQCVEYGTRMIFGQNGSTVAMIRRLLNSALVSVDQPDQLREGLRILVNQFHKFVKMSVVQSQLLMREAVTTQKLTVQVLES